MPEADQDLRITCRNFNRHAKFTIIEQVSNTQLKIKLLTFTLKKRKEFWKINILDCLNISSYKFST